ncbi:MAG: hypothetical protein LBM27_01430 [Lactobacillaceae bacterium]|jgi:type I restriction enzyme M protein|nr:hypothetical protein [Lactobacillaceae bacterium]
MSDESRGVRISFSAVKNWEEGKLPYSEEVVEFTWYKGLSWQQKQKSSISMRESIVLKKPDAKVLEISTKSDNYEFAQKLSAMNLKVDGQTLENVFQSGKVFDEKRGPNLDLLKTSPQKAKQFNRGLNPHLKYFQYKNKKFPLEPKTIFYDYLYLKALVQNSNIAEKLLDYDAFTDIEFNQKIAYDTVKGPFNSQARSAAIYVTLRKAKITPNEILDLINSSTDLQKLYPAKKEVSAIEKPDVQLGLFS